MGAPAAGSHFSTRCEIYRVLGEAAAAAAGRRSKNRPSCCRADSAWHISSFMRRRNCFMRDYVCKSGQTVRSQFRVSQEECVCLGGLP